MTDISNTKQIKKERIYKSSERKLLLVNLSKLTEFNDLKNIYNIITNDNDKYLSHNKNGVFINLNILSDECINKLNKYVKDSYIESNNNTNKIICTYNDTDNIEILSTFGHKFNNKEKSFIKNIHTSNL